MHLLHLKRPKIHQSTVRVRLSLKHSRNSITRVTLKKLTSMARREAMMSMVMITVKRVKKVKKVETTMAITVKKLKKKYGHLRKQ